MSALARTPAELEAQRAPSEGPRPGARQTSPLSTMQGMLGNRALRGWLAGSGTLQMKPHGSHADDPLELEADRHADVAASASWGAHTAGAAPPPPPAQGSSDGGEALPPSLRADMEAHFGRDFGAVRVHRDGTAQASARALDAHAFTSGADVAFGPGEYAPDAPRGRWLVAHELAHVVQQGAAPPLGGLAAGAPPAVARAPGTMQLKAKEEEDPSSPLAGKLKQSHGGLNAKLPLTPRLLSRVAALRSDGKASDEEGPESKEKEDKPRETELEKRHPGVAFVWDQSDERAIDATDVTQGSLGDCYFMALLAAIAEARPELIEQMIQENEDGTFTVRFGPDGQDHEIVEPLFPTNPHDYPSKPNEPQYARTGDVSPVVGVGRELWPMIIEKAWVQRVRHLNAQKTGAKAATGKLKTEDWQRIRGRSKWYQEHARFATGAEFEKYVLPGALSEEKLFDRLSDHFVRQRLPVTFVTPKEFGKKAKAANKDDEVHANHAYALQKVDPKRKTITLYNPHGPETDHLVDKQLSFLTAIFHSIRFYNIGMPVAAQTRAGKPTKEEQVAREAVPKALLKQSGYDDLVHLFGREINAMDSPMALHGVVLHYGRELWSRAKADAQRKDEPDTDDRPLYWARLQMSASLRALAPKGYTLTQLDKRMLLDVLETSSRGRTDLEFAQRDAKGRKQSKDENERRILVSGFDPFGFGGSKRTSNASGAAVLALDGEAVRPRTGRLWGRIEGVLFPVRFADFDKGIVEQTFGPYLRGRDAVDMIMTISQGGTDLAGKTAAKESESFEFEQFAGKRRSSSAPDNVDAKGVAKGDETGIGKNISPGPEFLESSLPWKEIHKQLGRKQTEAESELEYVPKGGTGAVRSKKGGVPEKEREGATAFAGSGGGYLSNEVFYRTAALREAEKSKVPVGHLHVPPVRKNKDEEGSEKERKSMRDRIVQWVRKIIAVALPYIGRKKVP